MCLVSAFLFLLFGGADFRLETMGPPSLMLIERPSYCKILDLVQGEGGEGK